MATLLTKGLHEVGGAVEVDEGPTAAGEISEVTLAGGEWQSARVDVEDDASMPLVDGSTLVVVVRS